MKTHLSAVVAAAMMIVPAVAQAQGTPKPDVTATRVTQTSGATKPGTGARTVKTTVVKTRHTKRVKH